MGRLRDLYDRAVAALGDVSEATKGRLDAFAMGLLDRAERVAREESRKRLDPLLWKYLAAGLVASAVLAVAGWLLATAALAFVGLGIAIAVTGTTFLVRTGTRRKLDGFIEGLRQKVAAEDE